MTTESDATVAAAAASAAVDSDIKISDAMASASSSKSTSPTDCASRVPNSVNNTDNTSNGTCIVNTDVSNHSGSNNVNDNDNSPTADKYITRLISGDEILLPRKDILIAVLKEYAADKSAEEKKMKEEVEKSEKEVIKAEEALAGADKKVAEAEEALRVAKKIANEEREKKDAAISKDKNAKDRAAAAKLTLESATAQLKDTETAPIAAIREFLESVQNTLKQGNEVEGKGVDSSGKRGGEVVEKGVGQQTPIAGKRKREEDDASDDHDGPPSKERKLDDSQGNGGVELPEGAEIDAELGVVFNSPLRPQLDMQCDAFFDSNEQNNTAFKSRISIKGSTLRPFVLDAINKYRAKLGQRPVPLVELIFLVNDKEAKSLEDGDAVSESVLLSGEVTVGIKHFPELTFEKLMRPFQVFQKLQGSKKIGYS